MIQLNFEEIFSQLKTEIIGLAQTTLKNYVNDAKKDGLALFESSKTKLERWTKLLANGELSTSEFEWLVFSQKDLVAMTALKQAGLAEIRADQFRDSVLNLITDTIFHLIKP